MINFSSDFLENFLAVVRKYMQLRGGLTQKDLSEMTGVGISTMSRFLNLKTASVDEQLVANIIATLNIPLHEVIDGVSEDSTDTFKRLVSFYRDQKPKEQGRPVQENDEFAAGLGGEEKPKVKTSATINIAGKKQNIPFGEASTAKTVKTTDLSLRDKLQTLSPRQKAYITDFLDLDIADRDLVVDLGDAVFRYIRSRSVEF
jgi:transcriptional regulator with XRE-family HTH domain